MSLRTLNIPKGSNDMTDVSFGEDSSIPWTTLKITFLKLNDKEENKFQRQKIRKSYDIATNLTSDQLNNTYS